MTDGMPIKEWRKDEMWVSVKRLKISKMSSFGEGVAAGLLELLEELELLLLESPEEDITAVFERPVVVGS
jgi:hypothetical protein